VNGISVTNSNTQYFSDAVQALLNEPATILNVRNFPSESASALNQGTPVGESGKYWWEYSNSWGVKTQYRNSASASKVLGPSSALLKCCFSVIWDEVTYMIWY
jgi:hypothetical protein